MAECELCQEVLLAGTARTGANVPDLPGGPFSRLIYRTPIVDVLAGIGSLTPGYVLIVPRRHVASAGELTSEELWHTYGIAWKVATAVKRVFGGTAVLVEHGSSGERNRLGRSCIEHSHLHLFPIAADADPHAFIPSRSEPSQGLEALSAAASEGRNYYYCSWRKWEGAISIAPDVVSQQARRAWARLIGLPDRWDWAAFPYLENCRLTTRTLARDASQVAGIRIEAISERSSLVETIDAYNRAAEWYTHRTVDYPPESSLKDEIENLADKTDGLILDAGAGSGRDALQFASMYRDVVALDAAVELVRRLPSKRGIFPMVGDVRSLPLRDNRVGAIWCSAVLLHLTRSEILEALEEFLRVLKPGGLAQISVKEGCGHSADEIPNRTELRRHFYYYNFADLESFSNKAGFDIADLWREAQLSDSGGTEDSWIKLLLRKSG